MECKCTPEEGKRMVDEMHAELMERAAELLPAEDLDRVEAAY